jgi:lipoprotein NlpD
MLTMFKRLLSLFVLILVLTSCATKTPAPVIDRRLPSTTTLPAPTTPAISTSSTSAVKPVLPTASASPSVQPKPIDVGKTHAVQKGETLYSIALQNNIDHRELAIWNNIDNPNVIKVGDVIRLSPPAALTATATTPIVTPLVVTPQPSAANERPPINSTTLKTEPRGGKIAYTDQALARLSVETSSPTPLTTATPVISVTPATITPPITTSTAPTTPAVAAKDAIEWVWPAKGKVITNFTELNKGIDIAGMRGTAVNAAAAGTVLHTGAGIRGYGRLVIIKHSTGWVSAYAHNDKITVMEGQEVKRGQKIAEMGNSDADQVKLHFEIRRQGKPVDPIGLLPKL